MYKYQKSIIIILFRNRSKLEFSGKLLRSRKIAYEYKTVKSFQLLLFSEPGNCVQK